MTAPLVVSGTYKDISITIYGEIHNRIDQTFYEQLDLTGKSIWVEHSTVLCELAPHQEPLFADAKGSEWIWFTRTKNKQPVECIDARIEMGLMSRIAEIGIKTQFDKVTSIKMMKDTIRTLLSYFQSTLSITNQLKPMWNETEEIKSDVEPLIERMKASAVEIVTDVTGKHDPDLLYDKCIQFCDDLVTANSMLLDLAIIANLDMYEEKLPIYLFVGRNHAIRLQKWLRLETRAMTSGSKKRKTRRR